MNKITIISLNQHDMQVNSLLTKSLTNNEWQELELCLHFKNQIDYKWRKRILHHSYIYVLKENNQFVSVLCYWNWLNSVYIADICTKKEFQNQKKGYTLLNKFIQIHNSKNISVRLDVSYDNKAINLYKRLGFKKSLFRYGFEKMRIGGVHMKKI